MKRVFILIALLLIGSEVSAKCSYSGTLQRQTLTLSNLKIPTDNSIPIGSVLYTHKFGTGTYKNFECNQKTNDQYIIDIGAPQVAGVTGIQGGPVYETGIDGIGFQVSDLLRSKNGSLIAAVAGSTLVPISKTADNYYKDITIWLIKTKSVIDINGTGASPSVSFSVGNIVTNPKATDRLLYTVKSIEFNNIKYRTKSCNISTPSSQVTLNRITKSKLMSLSQGAVTPSQKTIAMNISCPSDSIGNTLKYWFNPVGAVSASGDGIMENMLTGDTAASNVGIIFKLSERPIVFYDSDSYSYKISNNTQLTKKIELTADYYRMTNEITDGNVKSMLEVVIQEE